MGGALDLDRAPVPGVRLKLVGRFGPCYLNQLATVTNAENAGPDEPSHYGGQSSLALCEANVESGEIMKVLRAARKLHVAKAV